MKKQLLLFCTILCGCIVTTAQNVGIGTTTPLQRLHVKGPVRLDPAAASGDATISMYGGTTNDQSYIYFYNQLSAVTPRAYFGYSAPSDYGVWSKGSNTLYLNDAGLGIGISNHTQKLHVMGNIYGEAPNNTTSANLRLIAGASNTASIQFYHDVNTPSFSGSFGFSGAGSSSWVSGTITTLNPDGMGISNSSPLTKLHILGGQDAGMSNTTGNGYIMMGPGTGANLVIDNNEIIARNNATPAGAGADLFLQHDDGNVILCGNELGAVGIGVTTGASIPAGFLLAVDGKIISEEVKVQMSGNWPDYVFDKKYKLPTLTELKKFIAANKHLPNIPAAAEVEKNGLELGDMQKRMMEKIEELTLYILQLEEKYAALQQEVKEIKSYSPKK
jgi:hypothetical protein